MINKEFINDLVDKHINESVDAIKIEYGGGNFKYLIFNGSKIQTKQTEKTNYGKIPPPPILLELHRRAGYFGDVLLRKGIDSFESERNSIEPFVTIAIISSE